MAKRIADDEFLPSSVTDRPNPDDSAGEAVSTTVSNNQMTPQATVTENHIPDKQMTPLAPLSEDQDQATSSASTDTVPAIQITTQAPVPEQHVTDNQTTAQAAVSEHQNMQAQSSDLPPTTPRSLLEIRPLPKAGPRTGSKVGRKRGRTRILTDTPEKLQIEKEAAERNSAKKTKAYPKSKKNEKKGGKTKKKCRQSLTKCEKQQSQSESEDEETFCLICTEPYSNSRSREKWVQCTGCHMWAHEACTDGSKMFVCQNCDSCDVMTCRHEIKISRPLAFF